MSKTEIIKGYKVFNPDWTCRNKKYTCPSKFEEDVIPSVCERGLHFCKKAADCFNYYDFNPENHVAEVIAYGVVAEEKDKCSTDKLEIVREIPWAELLEIVNAGKGCTGINNTGDWNTGDWNTGDWNTGDWNTGDWNTGNRNTGNRNTGDWNTGNRNTGDWNTGDWNTSSFNTGCFMTEELEISMFNKLSAWSYKDWLNSNARQILNSIPKNVVEWVYSDDMTDAEKSEYPTHETMGGYLKVLDKSECAQLWWNSLTNEQKDIIKALPNFDKEIFKEITSIDTDE